MKRARLRKCIPIFIVAALIAAFVAAPIAATTMVSVDKKEANAGAAILIHADLGKPGNTAKIEFYYDANKNGIDDEGSAWTSVAQVKDGGSNNLIQGTSGQIEYRWVPASDLPPGHYLIRVTDSDNSTPKVAGVDLSSPATPQVSFLVDGSTVNRVKPAGFVTVQADVSNNCALCHSGDPSTWNASNPGFEEQKMKANVKADLSGLTGNASDTVVPAQMTMGHGLVGWNVQISPYIQEGAHVQTFIQVSEANLTISSHNATQEGINATHNATTNATNILNETSGAQSNTTLTVTAISAPTYVNDTVAVSVTVKNRGADPTSAAFLVFQDLPKQISVDNGGAYDIAPNSTAVFAVKIGAASGASGNYDLKFHATSGNLTSETRTIPIQIGSASAAAAKSPIPGFEAAFVVVGLVIAAYVVTRRR